jgi:hypothetical protein
MVLGFPTYQKVSGLECNDLWAQIHLGRLS